MIAFPRKGLKIETIGTDIYVKMTDNPSDENFEYNAHRRDTTQKDKFYIGAYEGSILSTKMRSLSNKQIGTSYTTNHVINEYRTYCNNNGYGYDMFSFYQLIFIQSMYILKYKNLNSQNTIGIGRLSTFSNTGTTDTNGMNYGSITNNTISVKLFGIEDLWGNAYDFIDGVKISSAGYILTSTINFNDIGNGYNQYEKLTTTNKSGYLNVATGTTEMGFAPKNFNGSATTYFCDNCFINLNTVLKFGGSQGDGNGAGIFCSYFSLLSSGKDIFTQTRLMYL